MQRKREEPFWVFTQWLGSWWLFTQWRCLGVVLSRWDNSLSLHGVALVISAFRPTFFACCLMTFRAPYKFVFTLHYIRLHYTADTLFTHKQARCLETRRQKIPQSVPSWWLTSPPGSLPTARQLRLTVSYVSKWMWCCYLSHDSVCSYKWHAQVCPGPRCTNNDRYGSLPLTLKSAPNTMQRYAPPRALQWEQNVCRNG